MFDFDGTLVDTEMVQYKAWRRALARSGVPFALADWRGVVGKAPDTFDPVALAERRAGRRLDPSALRADVLGEIERGIARGHLRPGVEAWLEDARAVGLPLAVASNSDGAWVHRWLDRLGIAGRFTAVATGDEVPMVKPAPDVYLLAMERLGVATLAGLAVEDSPLGAEAALAAGLDCVVVPNAFTRPLAFPAAARPRASFGVPPWRQMRGNARENP